MTNAWRPRRRAAQEKNAQQNVLEQFARLSRYAAALFFVLFVLALVIGLAFPQTQSLPSADASLALASSSTATPFSPTATPSPTRTPEPIPDAAIVAGHWSKPNPDDPSYIPDTGSVCPDGTREVDINYAVASRTVNLLTAKGYRVVLLEEFDPRLKNPIRETPDFAARVFLSIHSDACVTGPDYPLATGYKIAHAQPSQNPDADDRLVRCLTRDYDQVVKQWNLKFNTNTITPDMTMYHGFREIVPTTPAAIIELGFLGHDRAILLNQQDKLAQGIANGLTAFLTNDGCADNQQGQP